MHETSISIDISAGTLHVDEGTANTVMVTSKVGSELAVQDASPAACCSPLAKPDMEPEDATTTAGLFKALSDPNRVLILNLLANGEGPVCVCDINVHLPLSQPTVSHHLKKLTEAGLLTREQRGVWAFYDIDRKALARLGRIFRAEGSTR